MKNIFITGGTTGIGLALAKNFLSRGFKVGVCGRDLSKLEPALKNIPQLFSYQADVTSKEDLQKSIGDFALRNGGLDIIVANAGIGVGAKDGSLNFDLFEKVIDINVKGVLNTFEESVKHFKEREGHLVAISSVAAFSGLPGVGAYSASKAAVFRLCEGLSIDLKRKGISVTCICPGFIKTPLTDRNNHKMPFLISAEAGAEKISRAIMKKKDLYIFPWQMAFIMLFSEKLPRWIYRQLVLKLMGFIMPKKKEIN